MMRSISSYYYPLTDAIPLPSDALSEGSKGLPIEDMLPGESFFVPDGVRAELERVIRLRMAQLICNNSRFCVREANEYGVLGARVWRIS